MRSHGADAPREIYQFGTKGTKYYDAIEKYINLRYRLLPYIYSTSWDVTANQSSMMRALVMDFPNDKNALDINDQYMFGKSLLVSPVTNPMYVKPGVNGRDTIQVEDFSTIKSKETYLPAGADWYDFWTGEKFTGGNKVSKQTPLDIIPLYVKAGSVHSYLAQLFNMQKKKNGITLRYASIPELTENLYCTKMRMTTTIMKKEFTLLSLSIGMIKRKH